MMTNGLNKHILGSVKQIIPVYNVLEMCHSWKKDLNNPF